MKFKIIFFFSLISLNLFSQTGGETLYAFLNTATSPKQIALGGVALTSKDDVSLALWNPSILNEKIEGDVSVNYVNYIANIAVGSLAYAKSINPKYGIAYLGIQYFNYGDLNRTDASGPTILGTFSARDIAFNLGYGYTYQDFNFGMSVKYVSSKIDVYSSSALLLDLGVTYTDPNSNLVITGVLRNFGKQLTPFVNNTETITENLLISASYQLEYVPLKFYATIDEINQWDISVANPTNSETDLNGNTEEEEINLINNALRHVSGGVELWSGKKINLRLGYNHRKSQEFQLNEVRTRSGLSYGFGFNGKKIKFDYAFAKFQEGAKYSTFGLTLHL